MQLIATSIERPIAVIAAVIMTVMFGYIGLVTIPIQLAPDVNRPVITVETIWPGAAPAEVEREIVNRQEEVLKGLDGLKDMLSRSRTGQAEITLEFDISQNMDRALLLVANRLDRVQGYPAEVDQPTLSTAGAEDNAIAWFALTRKEGNTREIHTYGDFVEDVVQERFERVPGVSRSNAFGGSEQEMQVIVDPERLARYGLTISRVVAALRLANASVSAGDIEEGKRRYVVRAEGEFDHRRSECACDRGADSATSDFAHRADRSGHASAISLTSGSTSKEPRVPTDSISRSTRTRLPPMNAVRENRRQRHRDHGWH